MSSRSLRQLLLLPAGIRQLVASRRTRETSLRSTGALPHTARDFSTSRAQCADADGSAHAGSGSVNHLEVSHFNKLASSWWDPHGSSRLLHLMNPLRHKFIRQCLANGRREDTGGTMKYLDVGCGGGIFAESAARLQSTHSVTAIDPSPEVIAVAKRHQRQDPLLLSNGRLTYRNVAVEDIPVPMSLHESGYDLVTLFEVIEHIQQPSLFLQNCLKHLKPGGWLIGSTIARTNTSWFTTKVMAEDVLRLVPRGTHDWNQYIQPHELRTWARSRWELDTEGQGWQTMGVVYVPALGWKEVNGSAEWGNYFFGIRKKDVEE